MSRPQDRRRSERSPVLLRVNYAPSLGLLPDYLTDLSDGGLFIRTQAGLRVGDHLVLTLAFPGLLDPMPVEGLVRWRVPPEADRPDRPAGVGLEFTFRDADHRAEVARLVQRMRRPARALRLDNESGRFRVLLVEDNPFVHDLFHNAIRRFHQEMPELGALKVMGARDGQEGLLAAQDGDLELAIVDHFMPTMTGAELVRALRALPAVAGVPILMVSVGGEEVRRAALDAGADLFLDKPVLLKELLATLRLLVVEHQASAEGAQA